MAEVMTRTREEPQPAWLTMLSGSILEGVAGAGAIVLTILGLVGFYQFYMLGVATILIGAALIMEGAAVSGRMGHALHEATAGKVELTELGGGLSIEYLGGVGGIALGILGLAGVMPYVLWPIAAIVFGGAHVFGSAVTARVRTYRYSGEQEHVQRIANEVAKGAADVQAFIGLNGIALGILALIGFVPTILTLVAFLAFGFADLLRGPSITARAITRAF
jgi:hypothetical protein